MAYYGIEVMSNSGYLQISDQLTPMVVIQTGVITSFVWSNVFNRYIATLTSSSGYSLKNSLIFMRPNVAPTTTKEVCLRQRISPLTTAINLSSNSATSMAYVIAGQAPWAPQDAGDYGMEIWDTSGDLVWSTNQRLIHPVSSGLLSPLGGQVSPYASWNSNLYAMINNTYWSSYVGSPGQYQPYSTGLKWYVSGSTYAIQAESMLSGTYWEDQDPAFSNHNRMFATAKIGL